MAGARRWVNHETCSHVGMLPAPRCSSELYDKHAREQTVFYAQGDCLTRASVGRRNWP